MADPGDRLAVTLTRAQWERVMDVLGDTHNDAIAGSIAASMYSADSGPTMTRSTGR